MWRAAAVRLLEDHIVGLVALITCSEPLPVPEIVYSGAPPTPLKDIDLVHLAALAEHLARLPGREPPAWCLDSMYFLDPPYFAVPHRQGFLIETTPPARARRGLYVDATLRLETPLGSGGWTFSVI
jgi:hypothetical protein